MISRVLLTGCLLVCGLAQAQYPWDQNRPCGTTNGRGNPCVYSVPPDWEAKLLRENPQCTQVNPGHVTCSQPVRGSYGQFLMPAPRPGSLPITFTVPSTPPPLGVPPAQQAEADQLMERANQLAGNTSNGSVYLNRNRAAVVILLKAGNMGDKRAQATLGTFFKDGKGVKADDRAAAYWYSAAAAQGSRVAQYLLGEMYEEGEGGLPKDLRKATELYIKSANQGFGGAQMAMGIQYELGQEVPRSRQKAIELLRASNIGNGLWLAQMLANPKTPARFADEPAFDNYVGGLRRAEDTAAWAQARASMGNAGGRPNNGMANLGVQMYAQWLRNPSGPPPTH
jgi:TPR repeat protein